MVNRVGVVRSVNAALAAREAWVLHFSFTPQPGFILLRISPNAESIGAVADFQHHSQIENMPLGLY